METAHYSAVNRACACVNNAQHQAWKAFAGLNNNPLHKEPDVVRLGMHLRILHDVRSALEQSSEVVDEVSPILQEVREGIFDTMTNIILRLNEAAANNTSDMDVQAVTILKHNTEGPIMLASRRLTKMFEVFEIQNTKALGDNS